MTSFPYHPGNRIQREETERFKRFKRFKRFDVGDLLKRDKLNLEIFSMKNESQDDVDSLPPSDVLVTEIVDNLQAALMAFQSVADDLAVAFAPCHQC